RRDQPIRVAIVLGKGKNLDTKSERGCARNDAFILPTTHVLSAPTLASAIVSDQRDHIHFSAAAAPSTTCHQRTDHGIGSIAGIFGESFNTLSHLRADPRITTQSARNGGRSHAELLGYFRHPRCPNLLHEYSFGQERSRSADPHPPLI